MPYEYEEEPSERIRRGLETYAAYGDVKEAARRCRIKADQLEEWRDQHPKLWAEISENSAPGTVLRHAAASEGLIDLSNPIQAAILKNLEAKLPTLDAREQAVVLTAIAKSKDIDAKLAAQNRGRPTETVRHEIDMPTINKLIARLEAETVDGTVVELETGGNDGDV